MPGSLQAVDISTDIFLSADKTFDQPITKNKTRITKANTADTS